MLKSNAYRYTMMVTGVKMLLPTVKNGPLACWHTRKECASIMATTRNSVTHLFEALSSRTNIGIIKDENGQHVQRGQVLTIPGHEEELWVPARRMKLKEYHEQYGILLKQYYLKQYYTRFEKNPSVVITREDQIDVAAHYWDPATTTVYDCSFHPSSAQVLYIPCLAHFASSRHHLSLNNLIPSSSPEPFRQSRCQCRPQHQGRSSKPSTP